MKNSESAFPVQRQLREDGDVITYAEVGLTKREYFAAMAMKGFCANPAVFASNAVSGWALVNCDDATFAKVCIAHADILLAELAK